MMRVLLLTYSQPNPELLDADGADEVMPLVMTNGEWNDRVIEFAGRVCTNTVPRMGTAPAFVSRRIEQDHHVSLAEHGFATFFVTGVSRTMLAQATRHRHHSFSVRSQRYVDEARAGFVYPDAIAENPQAVALVDHALSASRDAYRALRQLGIAKEDARYILPEGTETALVVSANFSAWRWFFQMRCDRAAQWEVRRMATACLGELSKIAPGVFGDLSARYLS